ncbi:MAG: hypothetical protein HRU80_14585 [Ignavibacteriales bacterium]|nr:hypothetical protein [Ignavibacteriaceae bacterium]MCK6614861.1 hypothetical protein [Ignavibacteriaceae bacterium]QOJ30027.1 MAG: hypothetical protein HRU80_14585 [Ignavibacteriales bacterium]
MKKLFILFTFSLTFLFISGCSEDDTTPGPGGGTAVTSISGKLEGWTHGTGKTIMMGQYNGPSSFDAVGTGTIAADGSFTIALSAPMSFLLDSLTTQVPVCTGSFTSSTSGVMVYGTGGAMIMDGTSIFGFAQCTSRDFRNDSSVIYIPMLNDNILEIVYMTKATTVNGSQTCPQTFDGNTETMVTRQVNNLNFAAGWNKIYNKVTARGTSTATLQMSFTDPGTLKWYFFRIN